MESKVAEGNDVSGLIFGFPCQLSLILGTGPYVTMINQYHMIQLRLPASLSVAVRGSGWRPSGSASHVPAGFCTHTDTDTDTCHQEW